MNDWLFLYFVNGKDSCLLQVFDIIFLPFLIYTEAFLTCETYLWPLKLWPPDIFFILVLNLPLWFSTINIQFTDYTLFHLKTKSNQLHIHKGKNTKNNLNYEYCQLKKKKKNLQKSRIWTINKCSSFSFILPPLRPNLSHCVNSSLLT